MAVPRGNKMTLGELVLAVEMGIAGGSGATG